jgi:hypothetical protein
MQRLKMACEPLPLPSCFRMPRNAVIFLSGDRAAAQQLHAIVSDAEAAVVKEGLDNYSCISLSADSARRLIRDGAKAAMGKLGRIRPYRIEGPVTLQIEYTSRHALNHDAGLRPGFASKSFHLSPKFHELFYEQAGVLLRLAGARSDGERLNIQNQYVRNLDRLTTLVYKEFGTDKISWF